MISSGEAPGSSTGQSPSQRHPRSRRRRVVDQPAIGEDIHPLPVDEEFAPLASFQHEACCQGYRSRGWVVHPMAQLQPFTPSLGQSPVRHTGRSGPHPSMPPPSRMHPIPEPARLVLLIHAHGDKSHSSSLHVDHECPARGAIPHQALDIFLCLTLGPHLTLPGHILRGQKSCEDVVDICSAQWP